MTQISFEELRKAYHDWEPSTDDEYDEMSESARLRAMCFQGMIMDIHPIERVVTIAWLLAQYVDGKDRDESFKNMRDLAEEFLKDMDEARQQND